METILVIDDEEDLCRTLEKVLTREGYRAVWTTRGTQALELIRKEAPSCVLLDLKLADTDGLSLLGPIREFDDTLPVIMLTAFETVKSAVEAMKKGAFHYTAKPFDNEELLVLIAKAIEQRNLHRQIHQLKERLGESDDLEGFMGTSEKIQEVVRLVRSVAVTEVNVILLGESGTGKELVARAIHNLSDRAKGPFVPVDCGAIPETLVESELFGHEKGAFTGAASTHKGKFEAADSGSIFLDEVGNIPVGVQAKLLRFLESHEFERIGGTKPYKTSVRVIAATNVDLAQSSKDNLFRLDLFYRLNEFPIQLPPLRERQEDIPLLCRRFLFQLAPEVKKEISEISSGALEALHAYPFPGNVRELKNILKRAMVTAKGAIELSDLPPEVRTPQKKESADKEMRIPIPKGLSLKEASRQVASHIEKQLIQTALAKSEGRRGRAAQMLGIDEKTLYNKMKELGIRKAVGG